MNIGMIYLLWSPVTPPFHLRRINRLSDTCIQADSDGDGEGDMERDDGAEES